MHNHLSLDQIRKANDDFMRVYCMPDRSRKPKPVVTNPDVALRRWEKLLRDYAHVDRKYVGSYLSKISYRGQFLKTHWWYVISSYRKALDGYRCQSLNCEGDCDVLEVHHSTYEHRGFEIDHMDDLQTLCSTCHAREHNKNRWKKPKKVARNHELEVEYDPNKPLDFKRLSEWKSEADLDEFHEKISTLTMGGKHIIEIKGIGIDDASPADLCDIITSNLDSVLQVLSGH